MASLQSLVLTDRKTPTATTYTLLPVDEKDGVGFVAAADASGAALTELRAQIGRKRANGRARTTGKLSQPVVVVETISGVAMPKVARVHYFDYSVTFDDSSSEAERNDFMGLIASMFLATKPLIHDTIVKGSSVY